MKILFTSVGRRVELIQAFRNAATKNDIDLKIYGADMSLDAPALYFCDEKIQVPRISSNSYITTLFDVCRDNEIDALIPTIDTDLRILSDNKSKFKEIGTNIIISDRHKIEVCRDKRRTAELFESVGLKSPKPVDDINNYNGGYPAFIKPKDGSSSIFAYKVEDENELKMYSQQVPDYIIQPFIEGTEYTVDILCDFEGNPIFITPRIRIAVRSGEVLKTEIKQDEKIISEMKMFLNEYKPCGPITVQLIRDNKTQDDYYIEINPRFGGGAPLSIKAGADSAEAVLKLIDNKSMEYKELAAEDGAVYSRFDQSIRVK